MNQTTQYFVLLAVSIGLTFAVGRLLVRAGEPFLQEVFQDRKVTRSVNLLLSVLFHLVTLGVLAIISILEIQTDDPVQSFVVKLGVVLIVLGIAYGISMLVLIRVRDRRRASQISEQVQERLADRGISTVPSQSAPPVPNQPYLSQQAPPQQPAPQQQAPGQQTPPPADRAAT
ncbi:hypothetical protein [Pseudonocardia nigra]|uniref:hypothetical protein n=1 Tax=Pseudonocardia nigra TaxID=1921578 RepID=UPI001C5E2A72|nr:hypothetical protein [Pseudonocardia nigra]